MNRPTQTNRYQKTGTEPGSTLKGVHVARFLAASLLALNIILVMSILFSPNGLPGYRKQNQQVRELEGKVLELKADNQKLFDKIKSLKTSPKAQEKLVRQELGWSRENEIILEFADKENEGGEKAAVPIKPFGALK